MGGQFLCITGCYRIISRTLRMSIVATTALQWMRTSESVHCEEKEFLLADIDEASHLQTSV